MNQGFSIFNWSLKDVLLTEPSSFGKARIKILYILLLLAIIKLIIVVPLAWHYHQNFQLARGIILLILITSMARLLLYNKSLLKPISHVMIWIGLFLIGTNVFITAKTVNIATLQFVYMIIMSSFFLLDKRMGVFYSVLCILPVIIHLLAGDKTSMFDRSPELFGATGYQIIVILNFFTLVISHYLFHKAFISNIAEKEALNKQLQIAVAEANRAAQSKSDFLSTMSHELRTPLGLVIGIADLLKTGPHDHEQEENLKLLDFSASRLHALINDILDYNKLGSDKLLLEEISVNLYELMSAICSGLRFQAQQKGLDLTLEMEEEIKKTGVLTDPTRITQIVYNLIGNAIKFTSVGLVSLQLKVITKTEDALQIRISVSDTGIGIISDQQQNIFEPFVQASTSITRNFGGTGLGLAIVKRLLLLFGSKIQLISKEGLGSTFFFDLTLKVDTQAPPIPIMHTEAMADLSKLRVLIAEDDSMNRLLLKKVFSRWNNDPTFAENGEQAIEKLSLQTYDVILMDINMPVMDGYHASKVIRKLDNSKHSAIPIIALTASASNHLDRKVKEAGMNDYIFKPISSAELYGKLKDIEDKKPVY